MALKPHGLSRLALGAERGAEQEPSVLFSHVSSEYILLTSEMAKAKMLKC